MKKVLGVILGGLLLLPVVSNAADAQKAADNKKPVNSWTCEDFLAVDESFQPTAVGFAETKKFGIILFTLFITLHLASFFTPYYVTKQIRTEGHRIVGEILNNYNPQNIIFTYYEPERFLRYTDLRGKHTYSIYKNNRMDYIEAPAKILDNIPSGENVAVVFLDSVSFFDEDFVNQNKDNPKIPEMFLTFSHIKNSLIKALNDGFTDFKLSKIGAWTVIYATKK